MKQNILHKPVRWGRAIPGVLASVLLLTSNMPAAEFSGRVTDGGVGVGGVTIGYTYNAGPPGSYTTDGNGFWVSPGWGPNRDIVFTPVQDGYSFTPVRHSVSTGPFAGGGRSDLNFTRISYTISGTIKVGGVGVGGVTVTLSGAMNATTTTSSSGSYSFVRLRTGSYTITPSHPTFSFGPASLVTNLSPSRSGQDFRVLNPLATTAPASAIGFGAATLNGAVIGEGTIPTRIWFEYGIGTNLNLSTPVETLPAATNAVAVSARAVNLLGGFNHGYRLVAANTSGTNYGTNMTFSMPFPASANAIQFNGTTAYVSAGPNAALKVTTNLTIEAWINPTGAGNGGGGAGGVIAGREGEYLLARFADGTIRYALATTTPGWVYVDTAVVAPLNQWIHLAFTFDANATTNRARLYTNGVLAFSGQTTGIIGDVFPTQDDFRIGGRSGTTQLFHGQIDEVRVWNAARTTNEIAQNFQRRLTGSEPRLLAYFKFDESSPPSTFDIGPSKLTGTLVGGASFIVSGARVRDPVAITLEATPVLATRATLRGSVNPSDDGTVAYFEYGETIAYGGVTDGVDIGSGLENVAVSAAITGLQPGTTYHFRTVAFNAFGTTYGEDQTFMTLVLGVGWPTSSKVTGGFAAAPRHVVDGEGNAYVAGLFSGSATFRTTLVSSNANPEAFVAKLGRGADWLWESKVNSSANGSIAVNAIAVDAARNVYVAGAFSGTATFGTNVLNAAGQTDAFVAKLTSQGNAWAWARSVGAGQPDSANALAVTPSGSVFVAGHFRGAASLGTNNLSSAGGSQDIFVASLDTAGNWVWARAAGGTNQNDTALGLVLNSAGEAFVTGTFQGTNAAFGSTTLHASGGVADSDLFVTRLNADGLWLLARRAGGSGADAGTGLALDSGGSVYLLGQFAGTADYGGTVQNLNSGSEARLFVAKLNPNANLLWYAQAGAGSADAITVDGAGRVYVSGEFTVSTTFGSPPAFPPLVSSGNSDVFVARLDSEFGTWVWAKKIGSTGTESRGSVGVDAQGGIVVSGTFQSTVQVGFVLLATTNERDIFVARLDPDGVFEHNSYVIGQPVPIPVEAQRSSPDDGGAIAQPTITILEREHATSDALNSFVWSLSEHKLYPVRPVTAILKWPLTTNATNTTSVATAVGRTVFPTQPQLHVASAPVELEPAVPGFPYRFANLAFTTISGAAVDSSSKVFNAFDEGWTVLQFLDSGGEIPNPSIHPSKFEVAQTILWNGTNSPLVDNQTAIIGTAVTNLSHNDPTGKNGFVLFENSFYDGTGEERAYDLATRSGPIIPVNKDTGADDDDLVIAWYRTNAVTGIAWPSLPVRYFAQWPPNAEELVLASGEGSGTLDLTRFPSKRLYNQPNAALAGYNPNEEHAALYGDVLYALRNDLNAVVEASEPYVLLKHRDPVSGQWTMTVYHVVATNAQYRFAYTNAVREQLKLPAPLSLLPLCGASNTWISGPGFKDYLGRLYARAAGLNNADATIAARYWYPLQAGFFYDLDRDGEPDAAVGECLPWLDRRAGVATGVPIDVSYTIKWPSSVPSLQIGETWMDARSGTLTNLRHFARAQVIFDEGDPDGSDGAAGLTRLFDPLAARTVQLRPAGSTNFITGPGYSVFRVDDTAALFADLATANDAGMTVFTDLPFTLRSRLRYDSLNQNLIFRGLLDENEDYGENSPLLLVNVLSPRERERIKDLKEGQVMFSDLVDALYDLTRNPNQLDLDGDALPDTTLLVGLILNDEGEAVPEALGDGPKVLTAGTANATGYVTLVENNDPSLGHLPVKLHVIQVSGGPFRGDIKVVQSDNGFDEKLTLRHSGDFGGEPQHFEFEWYYKPTGTDPAIFPAVLANGDIGDLRGWTRYLPASPDPPGVNDITLGDGGETSLLVLSDNYFVCRYRGYAINGETNWSDWVGSLDGSRAQLAEGWVKRVRDGLNPFESRTKEFHANETVTFASMLQQAGTRYEGDIAVNRGGSINDIGLIEAYETVLRRAKRLSIEAETPQNYQPANDALLLAAGFIADLYLLLGNEAVADAADPTIGFRTSSAGYGTLAPSIFTFQNQLDSLLEEELTLLRGRDDGSATVQLAPVYNRLFWNFTRDEGEVAYAQAYNITDQNSDGSIDAADARVMYPQAHGDAWGHYLTATKTYYSLLQNSHFNWIPRSETILLSATEVEVDYLDERKFARAAAAKAKAGAEIVDLTYRLSYVDDPAGQFQGYKDTDPERAWGVSEWAHRAGSAAVFDWAIANAILPATDPNTNNTGLTKIDRTTVPELNEIVAGLEAVQSQVDKADAGLNPLGLAKNVVPFDIDPSLISSGKTHFEQIYDRALEAVNNTVAVFNHANQLSQALRGLQDNVNNFSQNVDQQERDYKNRLIEIFGYPYTGDIGAGKAYPTGYDGPDLLHYMYVNAVELNGEPTLQLTTNLVAYFAPLSQSTPGKINNAIDYFFPKDVPTASGTGSVTVVEGRLRVTYPMSATTYGLVAPPEWGQRRAPGELQQALSDMLQSQARLKQALANYDALLQKIDDSEELLNARFGLVAENIRIRNRADATVKTLRQKGLGFKVVAGILKAINGHIDSLTDITTESLPKVLGTSSDVTSTARGWVKAAAWIGKKVLKIGEAAAEGAAEAQKSAEEDTRRKETIEIEHAQYAYEIQQQLKELEQLIREEPALRLEAFALGEALTQNVGRYQAILARGVRLIEERIAFRSNAAAETQQSRYQDMTFRIFRNDAIQKYRAQFDLAAQYVFLAAVAYDFETQLLGGRAGAGRAFLTDIVRQRALGEVVNGVPIAGRHGLADPLARLNQNFGVLKGQLGFNNPQTETGRFSLRNELLRLRDTSHDEWRAELKKNIVSDLWDVPEFRRYCRPFAPESAGPQPGLVLRFPTTVTFGLNYFGWPLGGGDSAYDSTLFATKVRSAGVWFSDYNGSGLSITPRVYLVPAGADIMRSPSGNDLETREWRVVDQKIPVPFPIGFSSLNNPTWIPANDSLSDTFADIRRFSSFRAFHDSGIFEPSETISDSRLIGRSVWNTDWMLIIPGGTFLFDANQGLEKFIDSVSDIKIFFQTYGYSGN